ncbi:hypothetical protein [Corynebacterium sp. 13CS0277]|uniref:hypothetical protein n=1 Tax=Corynebacterium sp. 13CS0277 TaxID=2071994 RepID=UPI0011B29212|nr:hypothetical protein [Corynebacterium sp. 13CS0277]
MEDEAADLVRLVATACGEPHPTGVRGLLWLADHPSLVYAYDEPEAVACGIVELANYTTRMLDPGGAARLPHTLTVEGAHRMAHALGYPLPLDTVEAWCSDGVISVERLQQKLLHLPI